MIINKRLIEWKELNSESENLKESVNLALNIENEKENYTESTTTAEVAPMVNLWVWEWSSRGRNWDSEKRWGHLGNCDWQRGRREWEAAVVAEAAMVIEWRIGAVRWPYDHSECCFFATVSLWEPQKIL